MKNSYNSTAKKKPQRIQFKSRQREKTPKNKKQIEELNRCYSKEGMQMTNKHMKRYSTSKKCDQNHNVILSPVRMIINKRQEITDTGKNVEKRKLLRYPSFMEM